MLYAACLLYVYKQATACTMGVAHGGPYRARHQRLAGGHLLKAQ